MKLYIFGRLYALFVGTQRDIYNIQKLAVTSAYKSVIVVGVVSYVVYYFFSLVTPIALNWTMRRDQYVGNFRHNRGVQIFLVRDTTKQCCAVGEYAGLVDR